jgi:hypothetical protein
MWSRGRYFDYRTSKINCIKDKIGGVVTDVQLVAIAIILEELKRSDSI